MPYPGDFWHFARVQVLIAARAAMVDAIDAPYPAYQDPAGYRQAALQPGGLGYDGKWAIHPSQVPVANEVFSPTPAEVAEARAAVATYRESEAGGVGAMAATGNWSTPPTCGWPPTRCTRPRWRGCRGSPQRDRGALNQQLRGAYPMRSSSVGAAARTGVQSREI